MGISPHGYWCLSVLLAHFLDAGGHDLAHPLDGVGGHLHGQLLVGIGDGIVFTDQVDGIELALGGTLAAAQAHILVDLDGTAAQAALGLLLHLLFGEGDPVVPEGAGGLGIVADLLPGSVVKALYHDVGLVKGVVLPAVSAQGQALAGLDIAVDGDGALLARGNGVDGELGAGEGVAAYKDVGLGGLIGETNSLGGGVAVEDDLRSL